MGLAEAVSTVDLSADELLATFEIDGKQFQVECWEEFEHLQEIETNHLLTAEHGCRTCGTRFKWPRSEWGEPMRCAHCGSEDVEPNTAPQWDAMAARVREAYGVRCGRTAARTFYDTVLSTVGVAKKKNGPEPESLTGSDSTPEAGEIVVPSVG